MIRKYLLAIICFCTSVTVFSQVNSLTDIPVYPVEVKLENPGNRTPKDHSKHLNIIITNKADTSFSFLIMSCSWSSCTSFKPESIYRDYEGCPKNVVQLITLKPKESYILSDRFKISDSTLTSPLAVSVGFRIVLPGPDHLTEDPGMIPKSIENDISRLEYSAIYTEKNYIWSQPVLIKF